MVLWIAKWKEGMRKLEAATQEVLPPRIKGIMFKSDARIDTTLQQQLLRFGYKRLQPCEQFERQLMSLDSPEVLVQEVVVGLVHYVVVL